MSIKMETVLPEFSKLKGAEIKGTRTVNTITFNPDRAESGEEIYVTIPKLKPESCIVPNTLFLKATFKNKNTKSWFLNNLGRLLTETLTITIGGQRVYENTHESIYRVYEDLWLSSKERSNMIDQGIANQNTRKLMSKDDSADNTVLGDKMTSTIIGNTVRIKLGQILNNYGVYAPYNMNSDIQYKIRLPKADTIMTAQSNEAVAGYGLEGLKLEYETIDNKELADRVLNLYTIGRQLLYENVLYLHTSVWDKDVTLINQRKN